MKKAFRCIALYDAPRSIERTARGEERRKKKRDLNYFPKGFKSEILSETSLLLDFPGKTLSSRGLRERYKTTMKAFTLDDLMLGRVSARLGTSPDEENEDAEEREIVFSYPLGYKKKKKEREEQREVEDAILALGEGRRGAQNMDEEEEEEEREKMAELARRREEQMRMQREHREHMEKFVRGFPYSKKHEHEEEQREHQRVSSPRRAAETNKREQQNALTSPPRRITLQPSPLKVSNQPPEASPGMRALGLSPSPVKQIENSNYDRNRQRREIEDDETTKETLEYRGGYVDAHPKIEKPPSPPRGFFRKIDSVASDGKQERQQHRENDEDDAGALMVDSVFDNSDFSETVMSKVYATNASFKNVNFTNAVIDRATFDGSNMTGANFQNAVLTGVSYEGADLTGANFEEALIGDQDVKLLCLNPTVVDESRMQIGCKN